MGLRSQLQMKMQQKAKRKKRRDHLVAKGKTVSDYFYGKYFLKTGA
jgi:hypothetical protein